MLFGITRELLPHVVLEPLRQVRDPAQRRLQVVRSNISELIELPICFGGGRGGRSAASRAALVSANATCSSTACCRSRSLRCASSSLRRPLRQERPAPPRDGEPAPRLSRRSVRSRVTFAKPTS